MFLLPCYAIISTYNKKDEFIKGKLGPWFHGVPIILTIAIGIADLIMKQFNNSGGLGGNSHTVNFLPLQGLYNLIVYMSPKVRHARNTKRGKLPWRQAIVKAWMSRGEKEMAIDGYS